MHAVELGTLRKQTGISSSNLGRHPGQTQCEPGSESHKRQRQGCSTPKSLGSPVPDLRYAASGTTKRDGFTSIRRTLAPFVLAVSTLLAVLLQVSPAHSQDTAPLAEVIDALSEDDFNDLIDFVAGNSLFTLYHEAGHMLVSELKLPVLGQEEDAVDNLATVTMLAADTEDMDIMLSSAMFGWFLIGEDSFEDLVFYDEHDLNQQRGFQILCLMVGSDPDAFGDLAADLGLPDDRAQNCPFDYEQSASSWEAVTDPHVKEVGDTSRKIKVVHDPAPGETAPFDIFLKESELLETVAEEIDELYQLPEPVTFRAGTCGQENAFWDPNIREVILCHELVAGFATLYLNALANE